MEDRYYIHDIEAGYPIEVTKEQYESHRRMLDYFRLKVGGTKGIVMVFGTGGDMESPNGELYKLFYDRQ